MCTLMDTIDKNKFIRWECLARYFSEKKGKKLDMIFNNPLCDDEKRLEILNNLDITCNQKEFLLNIFDIDYLYIKNNKPILVEEKIKNIDGKKFQKGNYIYFDHGTNTQYKHLKEAYEFGIEAGILLRCLKLKRTPKGLLGYVLIDNENVKFERLKFYPIQNCVHLKYQTKIPVDDFIEKMRKKSNKNPFIFKVQLITKKVGT